MSTPDQPADPNASAGELPSAIELVEKIKAFLAMALRSDYPSLAEREATILYKESEASKCRTDAVVAAFLSDWHSMVRELETSEKLINLNHVVILLIHRTFNRMRRKKYRDDQMNQQCAAGKRKTPEGEVVPFDPEMPPWKLADVKNLEETIALTVKDWSPRDRMIVYMHYFEELRPAEIVERIRKEYPGTAVSQAVVSRVLDRFRDELRRRLDEESADQG